MDDREIDRAIATGRIREAQVMLSGFANMTQTRFFGLIKRTKRVFIKVRATMFLPSWQAASELDPAEVLEHLDSYEIEEV